MKKVTNFVVIIVILSTVAIIGLSFIGCKQTTPEAITVVTTVINTSTTTVATTAAITSAATAETTAKETETITKYTTSDQIKVTKPTPNQVIQSPLIVEGEARGTWYFEATFPVKLLDANGDVIASNPAQAQGEWMTEDFVLFKAELVFEKPSTDTGILILQKDNPSDLPENDASIEIPIRFK
jgi:hypothetical protein